MDQWEYCTVNFPKFLDRNYGMNEFTDELNKLGLEGWEMTAGTIPTNSKELICIFKRKIIKTDG